MYIPPSQYKTGFYSKGEFILPNKEKYIGPYFQLLNGTTYSGEKPNPSSKRIIQQQNLEDQIYSVNDIYPISNNTQIIEIIESNSSPRIIPVKYSLPKLPPNYPNSSIFRYFTKKANEFIYYEIDDLSYNGVSFRKKEYAWDLYDVVKVNWKIKGTLEEVYKFNKNQIFNIESIYSGKNLIGKNWPGFSQYFKDNFTKYYLES